MRDMPRQARLDAPGLVHHVMARGLNRQKIFQSRTDCDDFLRRLPHQPQPRPFRAAALLSEAARTLFQRPRPYSTQGHENL
jgi:hypothetical protein